MQLSPTFSTQSEGWESTVDVWEPFRVELPTRASARLLTSVLVSTLVWGGELAVITLGLNLSYSVIGYANWAHPEFVGVGAFLGLWAFTALGLPLFISLLIAMALTGLLGVLSELSVFRWLRRSSVGSKMLATVGLAIVIRTLVQFFGGTDARFFSTSLPPIVFTVGGTPVTTTQIAIVITTWASLGVFYFFLNRTHLGRILRATADNFTLAQIRGINVNQIVMLVWFIAGAYAGLAGFLLGYETFVRSTIGLTIILPMFAAATVGGLGSLGGAVLGALLLALAQNLLLAIDFGSIFGGSWLVPTGYKSALAVVVLVAVILIRPRGLLGEPSRD